MAIIQLNSVNNLKLAIKFQQCHRHFGGPASDEVPFYMLWLMFYALVENFANQNLHFHICMYLVYITLIMASWIRMGVCLISQDSLADTAMNPTTWLHVHIEVAIMHTATASAVDLNEIICLTHSTKNHLQVDNYLSIQLTLDNGYEPR